MKLDSQFILNAWKQASSLPLGKIVFSVMIKKLIPYTGSLGARVQRLEAGSCELKLKDRRAVRNHLNSIHAMALANLGEFCTGLAVVSGLPANHRSILKGFEISYLKKARGTLTAKSTYTHKETQEHSSDVAVEGNIFNSENELVASVKANWRIGKIS